MNLLASYKQRVIDKVIVAAGVELDIIMGSGAVSAEYIDDMSHAAGRRAAVLIKHHIACESMNKTIEFRHVEPASWWEHLKQTYPVMQKVFGPVKVKHVLSTVDASFKVCFPNYVLPPKMGGSFVLSEINMFKPGDDRTAMLVKPEHRGRVGEM